MEVDFSDLKRVINSLLKEGRMKNEYQEITVKNTEGETITLKLWWEADMFEWIENFKIILRWLTFPDNLIKETFPKEEE